MTRGYIPTDVEEQMKIVQEELSKLGEMIQTAYWGKPKDNRCWTMYTAGHRPSDGFPLLASCMQEKPCPEHEPKLTHNHPRYNGYMNDCPKCCEPKEEKCEHGSVDYCKPCYLKWKKEYSHQPETECKQCNSTGKVYIAKEGLRGLIGPFREICQCRMVETSQSQTDDGEWPQKGKEWDVKEYPTLSGNDFRISKNSINAIKERLNYKSVDKDQYISDIKTLIKYIDTLVGKGSERELVKLVIAVGALEKIAGLTRFEYTDKYVHNIARQALADIKGKNV